PQVVIDTLSHYYSQSNANVHRGVHQLSEQATVAFEQSREVVAKFLGLNVSRGCIFVRGATEAINLVAETWGRTHLKSGDEILVTMMEHHANIVPWQIIAERTGAKVVVAPLNARGELDLGAYQKLLSNRTKFVSFTHVIGLGRFFSFVPPLFGGHQERPIIDGDKKDYEPHHKSLYK
ncbi:MAG: aminotransferase class V-fold PLP-dependent enzyme, partial [Flavobacteriia bacterium]|nr:aminotransferase class V-fold PLP-dependent enzyme [Flavobacteriia bacterium]